MNKLSIVIVTKDRAELFERLLKDINKFDGEYEVVIVDNSEVDISLIKFNTAKQILNYDFQYAMEPDFISARNKSIELIRTPYFYIMDDDDLFVDNAKELFDKGINYMDKGYSMISYCWTKSGVEGHGSVMKVNLPEEKADALSSFYDYEYDKWNKIYLCNGVKIYNTELFRKVSKYTYQGYDDILPITDYYLSYFNFLHLGEPIMIRDVSSTVQSDKDLVIKRNYELNAAKSYATLVFKYKDDFDAIACLHKYINNTMDQIKEFDNYESVSLQYLSKLTYDILHNK